MLVVGLVLLLIQEGQLLTLMPLSSQLLVMLLVLAQNMLLAGLVAWQLPLKLL